MAKRITTVSLDENLVKEIDSFVKNNDAYADRSHFFTLIAKKEMSKTDAKSKK